MHPADRTLPPAAPSRGTRSIALVAAGALGVWTGTQTIRYYLAMVVWNVAEDRPANEIGLVAGAVWAIGLLAWLPDRLIGRVHAHRALAATYAAALAVRSLVQHESATPALAFVACVLWLWWLPAWMRAAALGAGGRAIALAVALGAMLQLAGQHALHGLDLQALSGWPAATLGVALAGAFVVAAFAAARTEAAAPDGGGAPARYALVGFGPFLFLLVALLGNAGRMQMVSGLTLTPAVLAIQAGVLIGLAAGLSWPRAWLAAASCAVAAAVVLAGPALDSTAGVALALLPAAAVYAMTVLWLAPGVPGRGLHGGYVAGGVLFFVQLFLFYSRIDWMAVLAVAFLLLGLVALAARPARDAAPLGAPATAIGAAAAAMLLGATVGQLPHGGASGAARASGEALVVMSYNIHQGLDARSVPNIAGIAAELERADADVIALHEVNRGMTISGGVDYFAWLAWRFPQYRAIYGPMHGQLYGNTILTRLPVRASGWARYPRGPSGQVRGYAWADGEWRGRTIRIATTHLTPYNRGAERAERAEQAGILLASLGDVRLAIVAGDLNDTPESAAVRALAGGGLRDAVAEKLAGAPGTHPADRPARRIDYVMAGSAFEAVAAEIGATTASDHRPVIVRLRLHPPN